MAALIEPGPHPTFRAGLLALLRARPRRWVCFRDHIDPMSFEPRFYPRECKSFGDWLLCQVFLHQPHAWRMWLMNVGFVDSLTEGGLAFWRWDFWNSHMRAELKRIEGRPRGDAA